MFGYANSAGQRTDAVWHDLVITTRTNLIKSRLEDNLQPNNHRISEEKLRQMNQQVTLLTAIGQYRPFESRLPGMGLLSDCIRVFPQKLRDRQTLTKPHAAPSPMMRRV